ncbi:hypothetical protein GLI01_08990 [Gluconacetobacter liquefaciens]|uniref:ABC transporter family protein n=1 Tax=Gluconacetobacter liquefaciens TaxID=89584 RepID=A0A370GDR5_GLULI|nr:ABC transporter family protein [Gluconacetobacter liquefaciens]GEB36864.1 hypothetical protein GLI01_08990 [Gluconacetobacter liquefaciens]
MVTTLLQVEHASRHFGGQTALDDVSFQVRPGEILGIIGRSGAGKSTLLRCLNGLERPDSGRILIEDRDITTLPERELVQVRRRIGLVFQHFNLLNARTVAGNIELPLQIAGMPRDKRRARRRIAGTGRIDRACEQAPQPVIGRPETARGHCPGTGGPPGPAAV